jgi:nucleotide-binding universal stress UspA family protein
VKEIVANYFDGNPESRKICEMKVVYEQTAAVRVVETLILSGVLFDQIVRHAERHDANVIFMRAGEKSDNN